MGLAQFFGPLPLRRFRIFPLAVLVLVAASQRDGYGDQSPPNETVKQFKAETVFWKQIEIGRRLVWANDTSVLPQLEPWLAHPDRHIRGNAAFVFAGLGDPRGLDVIAAILGDYSERPEGQGVACALRGNGAACWSLSFQIAADRYYAVHLLGELKDARAVPMLVSFLDDSAINYKITWTLQNIGGLAGIDGLIAALRSSSAQVRVLAVEYLEDLQASEALPELLPLLGDDALSSYDRRGYVSQGITVSEAARAAITALQHR